VACSSNGSALNGDCDKNNERKSRECHQASCDQPRTIALHEFRHVSPPSCQAKLRRRERGSRCESFSTSNSGQTPGSSWWSERPVTGIAGTREQTGETTTTERYPFQSRRPRRGRVWEDAARRSLTGSMAPLSAFRKTSAEAEAFPPHDTSRKGAGEVKTFLRKFPKTGWGLDARIRSGFENLKAKGKA
jgi:hypothetical protein